MMRTLLVVAAVPLGLACSTLGVSQDVERRPLDHESCDDWRTIQGTALSETGAWITFSLRPADGDDGELVVRETRGDQEWVLERGSGAAFDFGERYCAFKIAPPREEVREAKKKKGKAQKDAEPKDELGLLDLASGELVTIERVKSFALPEERAGWIAYLREEAIDEPDEAAEGEETPGEPAAEPEEEAEDEEEDEKKKDGTDLVLRELATGREVVFPHAVSYAFPKDGRHLAYVASTKDDGDDGFFVVQVDRGEPHALSELEGDYAGIAFDESSTQLTFLSNSADYAADEPEWTLYHSRENEGARAVATAGTAGIADGWGVSRHRVPSFSDSGKRLLFGTAPLPAPEPEEVEEEDEVVVDVWSWTDDRLQPEQLVNLEQDRKRSHLAVLDLVDGGVVQLGSEELSNVDLAEKGDSAVALGVSDLPYRRMSSWDSDVFRDAYAIDVATGERRLLVERRPSRYQLSPGGRYAYWWDGSVRSWFAIDVRGGDPVDVGAGVPHPLQNVLHDHPRLPRSYGSGGWLEDDVGFIVYDEHDVWLLDPTGRAEPRSITRGVGRRLGLRFRRVDLDPEEPAIDPTEALLLSTMDVETRASGFWTGDWLGDGEPTELVMDECRFSTPTKAKDGDLVRFTRQSFVEYPDVWIAGTDLSDPTRVSEANPQQAEFLWGTAELVRWTSTDGTPLEGVLYKPEDFDPDRQYPLVTYFYERNADNLHRHNDPIPNRSTIRFPFYTSRGYLVFMPDIPYRVGYPGMSAEKAVLSGVSSLIDQGFVDPDRIGMQGHSWGGYQVSHLVTRTDLFAAAVAGAPVANMTSAYGGIRWASGMSRMWQYEKSQSRLGGTLWQVHNRYIENSPLFFADEVETPLLILHNDEDGAVPWYQGIELFVALRRLDRPAWLLNYNGEPHGLTKYPNKRDYSIRMAQFFDHYLKNAPAPTWMQNGLPALDKGRTLGLDLVPGPNEEGPP